MKRIIYKLAAFCVLAGLCVVVLAGCRRNVGVSIFTKQIEGTGVMSTEVITNLDGKAIEIGRIHTKEGNTTKGVEVRFYPGEEKSIEIEAQENLHDYLKVSEKNGTISILGGLNEVYVTSEIRITVTGYVFDEFSLATCKGSVDPATVGAKPSFVLSGASSLLFGSIEREEISLTLSGGSSAMIGVSGAGKLSVGISGASSVHLAETNADEFRTELSGGSSLVVQTAEVGEFSANLSGGSRISADGFARNAKIKASGGSNILFRELTIASADVIFSGGSEGEIGRVSDRLSYDLSGGSELIYSGTPKIGKANLSGGAEAISKDGN